jgi:large subunit ribosomal protein L7/L12
MKMESLIEQLSALDTSQITELRTRLEEKWGVKVQLNTASVPVQQVQEQKTEKTEFDLYLTGFAADKKIRVIQLVREITGKPLVESRNFVEASATGPQELKLCVSRADADEIQRKLVEVGGVVEIK